MGVAEVLFRVMSRFAEWERSGEPASDVEVRGVGALGRVDE